MSRVSELLMIATTIGNKKDGFYPAIKINGYTYAFRPTSGYMSEERANEMSILKLTQIKEWVRKDALKMWER